MAAKRRQQKSPHVGGASDSFQLFQGEIVGEWWLPYLFGVLASVIFLMTMCPTVPGGDSGELISVAAALGVAHPPGYPLYTMLGHLMTYLPIGSVAWRVNLFSAICALASGLVLYHLVVQWLRDRWLGILAAGIFIFSPLAWRYAVVAEVFTLNNLFIVGLLYVTLRFCQEPSQKWAYVWAGLFGLSCSHHHTIIFLAIPIFLSLFWKHFRLLSEPKVFLGCFALFLLGFLPYLYLPWAAQHKLMISWGDPSTWDGFWTHFLRREYGTFQLATGDRNFWNTFSNLRHFAGDIWLQFLFIGVPVAVYGLWQLLRRSQAEFYARVICVAWVFYVLVFHALANMDLSNRLFYDVQSRFWLLPNIIMAIFLAVGLKLLMQKVPRHRDTLKAGVIALAIGFQVGLHYDMEDHSRNTIFHDLGKSTLDGLPQGALVFLRGDVYVNSVRYMQAVEKYRTDVMAIPFDLLWWPWMKGIVEANYPKIKWPGQVYRYKRGSLKEFTLRDFFELNYGQQDTFIGKLADYEVANMSEKFTLVPVGFLNRIRPAGAPFDFELFRKDVNGFAGFASPSKEEIREKSWEAFIYYNFWDRELEKAKFLFSEGTKGGENLEMITYGASILERLVREYPEAPAGAYRNLGVAYQVLGRRDQRYLPMMAKAWEKYLSFNPVDDPQLPGIRGAVEQIQRATSQAVTIK